MDRVTKLAGDNPVVIFSYSTCPVCHTIKSLICSFGANPRVYEIDELPDGRQLESALVESSGQRLSLPVVFIGQELVGGSNEVISLHVKNKLVPLLKKANAIWV